jgi:acetyl esterase/lipase
MKFPTILTITCLAIRAAFAADATVQKDIPYVANGHPRQTLDLYLPAGEHAAPLPLIVWIHGGAWKLGSKDWITVRYLVDHGYALASIGYRFSQDAIFPAQIQDCNAALDFLLKNAKKYHLDPNRVIIGGGSAGGHLALLLGLARKQKTWGADPNFHAQAILDFFGVTDIAAAKKGITDPAKLAEIDSIYRQLLGALPAARPDLAKAASPLAYVTRDTPPVLIIHGEKDDTVPLDQSRSLKSALDTLKVRNQLIIVPGAGHDGPLFASPELQKPVLEFLGATPASPPRP